LQILNKICELIPIPATSGGNLAPGKVDIEGYVPKNSGMGASGTAQWG
jgi:hypothetical protein